MEPTEQESLLSKGRDEGKQNFWRYFRLDRLLMAISILIAVGVLIASIVGSVSKTSSVKSNIDEKFGPLTNPVTVPIPDGSKVTVPHAYGIPDNATTPVKDQMNMGTCWAFSTIGALEASYRQNGIAKGYLDEDEFVTFSVTAYAHTIVDYCTGHPNTPQCYGTGPNIGSVEDGPTEWLYYFGEEVQKLLPSHACDYQNSEDDCPDRKENLETTPLIFTVKGIKTAYSVTGIKELLFEKKTALTWGSVIDSQTYMVPCDQFDVSILPDECLQCTFLIDPTDVFDITQPDYSKCYALYTLPSYDNEGLFSLHGKPFFSGGHAMLLVGYNDSFRVDTGRFGQLEERTLGGFIVKNSWGYNLGHSIKYWTQEISNMEEAQLCPDETAATKWLPADVDCMVNQHKSVEECSSSRYKRVRNSWVEGATKLKCTDITPDRRAYYGFAECNPERNYVLAQVPEIEYLLVKQATSNVWTETQENSDGFFDVKMIEFNPNAPNDPAVLVTAKRTTWLGLSKVLTPLGPLIGNEEERCGYYFIPYQYFQEGLTRGPKFGHDNAISVTYYDIEWEDSAYLKNKDKYPQFDYTELIASSGKMKMYEFQGPLDYDTIKNS